MVTRICPVCGSTNETKVFAIDNTDNHKIDQYSFSSRKVPEYMHYQLIDCSQCGVLFANLIPDRRSFERAYSDALFDSEFEALCASRTYAKKLSDILKNIPDLCGALDIGTGTGCFLEELVVKGFTDIVGTEPSKAPILKAKKHIRSLIKNECFIPNNYTKDSFSLITCFQTLEHLYDPLDDCRSIFNLLKPGGVGYFVCHNRNSLSAKILKMRSPIFDIEHLQIFSKESAIYLLRNSGFINIEVNDIWNLYPLYYWIKLLPFPAPVKRKIINFLERSKVGSIPVTLPAGNFAIIGYKKGG